ncbi:DUF5954 family protein [Streptomyces varsoviensis]|uniref:LigA protein n=1 Tax=Streptomyces varsoviensis TaxID=67373 RepID=A0ABR5JE66_9ACTN|nr:DUF5954 family protein [Streptomyces varsoviensis]KOG91700.1 hypothetical protein ADK38_01720 [Streptomyces varsoviensis]
MDHRDVKPGRMRRIVVRYPEDPVESVAEADALDAAVGIETLLVRGPLFGVAAQDAGETSRWRVVVALEAGCPQQARDSLQSTLWFRAKDEAQDRTERRALLAAVARLETERVDELTVLGTRYRVVRADEYAGMGRDGIERPRPTDPEPAVPNWARGAKEPRVDEGLVMDPDAPMTPTQAAERLALTGMAYAGSRYPEPVRADSRQALRTHPDVMLLPAVFRVVEIAEDELAKGNGAGWEIGSGLHATAHDVRKTMDFSLTWFEPRQRGLIPWGADGNTDARTVIAEGTDPAVEELAAYVRAAAPLRTERADEVAFRGLVRRICRARRLLRWGPDGPEGPRPSDIDTHPPEKLHPFLDEDGVIHFEEEEEDEDDDKDAAEGDGS